MARPRKPAQVKAGKSETKEHLNERSKVEKQMAGNNDRIKNVPETLDSLGKEYYKILIGDLSEAAFLSNLDIPLLTQTADCLSKMQQADKIIDEDGIMYITYDKMGNKIPKEHPMVGTKQKYLNQYRALCTQLGLSPSARASLSEMKVQAAKNEEDPVLQILKEFSNN
jgi:P27 family predicted phage terminase small subunit